MVLNALLKNFRRSLNRSQMRRNPQKGGLTSVQLEQLETRQLLTVNFQFNYEAAIGAGTASGFEDPVDGPARRAALEDAAASLGAIFADNATLEINVTGFDNPLSGVLASAGSALTRAVNSPGTFGEIEVIRNKVVNGLDLNGATADGTVNVNWGQPWEISADPADVNSQEFDFYTVVYHELLHGFGFASVVGQDGSSLFSVPAGQPSDFSLFDSFIVDPNGNRVIDAGGAVDANLWNTHSIGGSSAQNLGLFFNGAATVAANGGQPVGLYTPTQWSGGSSVSHIDTENPAYAGFIMLHSVGTGPATRTLSTIEEGILTDMGYSLANAVVVTETGTGTTVGDLGSSDTFTVALGRPPASDVVINVASGDVNEVVSQPATLTFTPINWDNPQTVTVTGVPDGRPDGDKVTPVTLSIDAALSDDTFDGLRDIPVDVTSLDNDGAIPDQPVLTAPSGIIADTMPLFSWTSGANSDSFTLTITDLFTGTRFRSVSGLTSNDHLFSLPIPNGTYETTVQAFNSVGQAGPVSDPLIFAVGTPVLPVAPIVTSPTAGQRVPVSDPQFAWSPVSGAISYEIVATSGGQTFTDIVAATATGNPVHKFTQLFAEGAGTVKVRGLNAFDQPGPFSETVTFEVDAVSVPARPTIIRPSAEVTSNPFPEFRWLAPGGNTYELWVGRIPDADGAGTASTVNNRVIRLTDHNGTSYTHFLPLQNNNYRAWVRSFNIAGEPSEWSRPVVFEVNVPQPDRPAVVSYIENQGTNPTITWATTGEDYTPGTTFHLWVNNLSTGQARAVQEMELEAQTFAFADGLDQGKYGAWVQATTAIGSKSAWSRRFDFEIDIAAPSRPVLTGPAPLEGDVDVKTDFPTFAWDAVDNGETYDLWVNSVSSNISQIIRVTDIPAGTSYTHDEALPEGEYKAWLRSFNISGEVGEWSLPLVFTLDVPGPARPTITGPVPSSGGAVETSTPTIKWTSLGGTATYNLQLEVARTGERIVNTTGLKTQSFDVTEKLSEEAHRVRVQGVNSVGELGAWSDWYTFKVDVPNATTPIAFLPQGTVTRSRVTFQWQHTSSSVRYEILVRDLLRDEEVAFQVSSLQIDQSSNRAVHTADLDDGAYRFWVRAYNTQNTASGWSNSRSFIVDTVASLTDESASQLDIALTSLKRIDEPASAPEAITLKSPASTEVTQVDSEGNVAAAEGAESVAEFESVMAEFADPAAPLFAEEV